MSELYVRDDGCCPHGALVEFPQAATPSDERGHADCHCVMERCDCWDYRAATPSDEKLLRLIHELAEEYHQTGSLRDHADPADRTGWNVKGIETCEDRLCQEVRAALAETRSDPDGAE